MANRKSHIHFIESACVHIQSYQSPITCCQASRIVKARPRRGTARFPSFQSLVHTNYVTVTLYCSDEVYCNFFTARSLKTRAGPATSLCRWDPLTQGVTSEPQPPEPIQKNPSTRKVELNVLKDLI